VVLKREARSPQGAPVTEPGNGTRRYARFRTDVCDQIRGSEQEIMDELAKFPGIPMRDSSTCDLWRFGRLQGSPTKSDRLIRYRVPFAGFGAEFALDQAGRLGDLVLPVRQAACGPRTTSSISHRTKDGNRGLSIYAAFELQERPGLYGSGSVGSCQGFVSGIRARRGVESCPYARLKEEVERKAHLRPTRPH